MKNFYFNSFVLHVHKRKLIRWLPTWNGDMRHFYWLKFELIIMW